MGRQRTVPAGLLSRKRTLKPRAMAAADVDIDSRGDFIFGAGRAHWSSI
jgi:hypothetical protein